ncbi:SwmB domain-containing protein [Paenibacillus marinisediminis]
MKKTTALLLAFTLMLEAASATAYAEAAVNMNANHGRAEKALKASTVVALDPDTVKRAPVLEEMYPANGATQVATDSLISFTFSENVSKGGGNLVIRDSNGNVVEQTDVGSKRVSVDGSYVEWVLRNRLEAGKTYSVQLDNGTFVGKRGEFQGLYDANQWRFTTAGVQKAPELVKLVPANGETQVAANADLQLYFDEEVWKNTGEILLINVTRNTLEERIPITSDQVTGSGTKVININPNITFRSGEVYGVTVTDDALRDADYMAYAGLTNTNAWRFTVKASADTTAPVLQQARMDTSKKIRLEYNENLREGSVPPISNFLVYVNGEARALKSTAVTGKAVDIELSSGVSAGQIVILYYAPQPGTRMIEDNDRNAAAAISGIQVKNDMEVTAPKVTDATFSGARVTLQFNERLASVSSSADEQFTVWVDGKEKSIRRIEHSGSQVTLVMSESIASNKSVKIDYTPGKYPLQNETGNPLQAFRDRYARGGNDSTAPVYQKSTVSGNKLTIQYNEALKTDSIPLRSHYSVLVNNAARYVDKVEIVNDSVVLTLNSAVNSSDSVLLSYVPGEPRLTDLSGNGAAAFSFAVVANSSDNTVPVLKQGVVKNAIITLQFSEKLKLANNTSPLGNFYVFVDGTNRSITSTSLNGDTVTLTLESAVSSVASVRLTYAPGNNPLQDESGNRVELFADYGLSNQTDGSVGLPADVKQVPYDWFLENGMYYLETAAANTSSDRSRFGESIKKYTLQESKLKEALRYAVRYGSSKHLMFNVPTSEKAAMVAVPVNVLDDIRQESSNARFSVRYGDVLYTLPLDTLDTRDIKKDFSSNSSVYLLIQLESAGSVSKGSELVREVRSTGGQMKAAPVDFYLSAYTSSTNTKSVTASYEARFRTSNSLAGDRSTVVRYDEGADRIQYVPNTLKQSGGTSVFRLISSGNDIYAAAERKRSFSDTSSHWARAAIEELASKYIIEGVSSDRFAPNDKLTRGQFATLLARSFGLPGDADAASRYRDIGSWHPMAASIGAATRAGIISGYEDGSFRPNDNITREQMAVMLVRAVEAAGQKAPYDSTALSKFKDRGSISSYAREAVIQAVSAEFITGVNANTFDPKGEATRAQAVVMLKRLLEHVEYLTRS